MTYNVFSGTLNLTQSIMSLASVWPALMKIIIIITWWKWRCCVCVVDYQGPAPPVDTGYHRYQLLLFEQDTADVEPVVSEGRGGWDLNAFVRANNLCNSLVAASQFLAANQDSD